MGPITVGSTVENIFDRDPTNRNYFGNLTSATVFSDQCLAPLELEQYLSSEDKPAKSKRWGTIIVVGRRDKYRVTVTDLIALASRWNIPGSAMVPLFSVHGSICRLGNLTFHSQAGYTWRHAVFSLQPENVDDTPDDLHIIQSFKLDADAGADSLRSIIFCPKKWYDEMMQITEKYTFEPEFDKAPILNSTRFLMRLLGPVVEKWSKSTTDFNMASVFLNRTIQESASSLAWTEVDQTCREYVVALNHRRNGLRENSMGLQRLQKFFGPHCTSQHMTSVNNILDYYISTFEALERGSSEILQELNENRRTMSARREIQTWQYLRMNITELRRIAQQNEREAVQVQELTKAAQRDAMEMKRIAKLTMFYLPATFVATVFGMPFLDLDDNLAFSNIKKIWVFFVISVILTSLTFFASYYWDIRFKTISRQSVTTGSSNTSGEEPVVGGDGRERVFEPDPAKPPDTTEVMQRVVNKGIVIATLQKRIAEEPESGLEHIGFDDLNNLVPLANDNETYTGETLEVYVEFFLASLKARESKNERDTGRVIEEELDTESPSENDEVED